LEPCSGRADPAIENCKDCMGMVRLSFYWDAFGIERMVEEKTANVDFGGVASPRLLTPSARARLARWVCRAAHLGLQNRVSGVPRRPCKEEQ